MIETDSFSPGGRGSGLGIGSSRFFLPFVAFLVMIGAAILAANIISSDTSNPVAVLLLISGICLGFFAQMRPWYAFLTFLWLAVTIDAVKRLTYAASTMSFVDVAYILAVPVIMMGALYARILLLQWFAQDDTIDKIQFKKLVPIMGFMVLITFGVLAKDGISFGSLSKYYTTFCYIPVAAVIPLLLSDPSRWYATSRQLFWITITIGAYGVVQAWHGPFDYEMGYLQSGLTATENILADGDRFRAFSFLNASATFAGVMVIATLYALHSYCVEDGRLQLKGWRAKALVAFCFVVCMLATQRGAFFCGLLTFFMLPLFSRPKLLQAAFAGFIGLFILMVTHIDGFWRWVQVTNQNLEPFRVNDFLRANTDLLTFGARVESFELLQIPSTWSAFGLGSQGDGLLVHDLVTQLVVWIGWVGLLIFFALTAGLLAMSSSLLNKLQQNPAAYVWAQVNLAVFIFIVVWSMLLGSNISISPINFFFWFSIGNLLYMQGNTRLAEATRSKQAKARDLAAMLAYVN